eukprot:GHVT01009728.1.p1 GENE.GHVT01009728.1~~GHVT01009728.1.p1  ORF type:complete len:516 (+),score=13.71 GHVT01009728.1:297-1844(+)
MTLSSSPQCSRKSCWVLICTIFLCRAVAAQLLADPPDPDSNSVSLRNVECYCPKNFTKDGQLCIHRSHSAKLETCPYDPVHGHTDQCLKPIPSGPYCEHGAIFVPKVGCVSGSTASPTVECQGTIKNGLCVDLQSSVALPKCEPGFVYDEQIEYCTRLKLSPATEDCVVEPVDVKCETQHTIAFTLSCPVGWRLDNNRCVRVEHTHAIHHCADEAMLLRAGAQLVRHEAEYCLFHSTEDHPICSKNPHGSIPPIGKQPPKPCVRHIRVPLVRKCPPSYSLLPEFGMKSSAIGADQGLAGGVEEAHFTPKKPNPECFRTRFQIPDTTCAGTIKDNRCEVTIPLKPSLVCPGLVINQQCGCTLAIPPSFFCPDGYFFAIDAPILEESNIGGANIKQIDILANVTNLIENRQKIPTVPWCTPIEALAPPPLCIRYKDRPLEITCPDNYVHQNGQCVSNKISKPLRCPADAVSAEGNCFIEVPFIRQCPPAHVSIDSTELCLKEHKYPLVCPHLRKSHA